MLAQLEMIDLGRIVSMLGLVIGKVTARRIDRRRGQAQRLKLFKKLFRLVV